MSFGNSQWRFTVVHHRPLVQCTFNKLEMSILYSYCSRLLGEFCKLCLQSVHVRCATYNCRIYAVSHYMTKLHFGEVKKRRAHYKPSTKWIARVNQSDARWIDANQTECSWCFLSPNHRLMKKSAYPVTVSMFILRVVLILLRVRMKICPLHFRGMM